MIDAKAALISLRPGAEWTWSGPEYSGLNWLDQEQTKPTVQEINAEIEKLKQQELDRYYQQPRREEYPPLSELADALYWQSQGDDSRITAYLAACDAVKQRYPKDMPVSADIQAAIESVPLLQEQGEEDNG